MTQINKIILFFLLVLSAWGIIAFFVVGVDTVPLYDNTERDSIQLRIDTIKVHVVEWKTRIKSIKETDTIIYNGTDTVCGGIIGRKDKIIAEQDTVIDLLDLEARSYSDLAQIEVKRNVALLDSIGTINQFYKDSLSAVNKRLYSGYFSRNIKWNKNKFREYVMKKAAN
jgi:hypothetical protein